MTDAASNRVSLAGVPSGTGIVQGPKYGSGQIDVAVGGTIISMQVARDLTPDTNDRVAFVKANGIWAVVCRLDSTGVGELPVDNPTPPPPKPVEVSSSNTFTPVETRSYQGSKWRTDNDDVYQGQYGGNGNHRGCAFFGNGPRSLAGATVTRATVRLRRKNGGGITAAQSTTFWLVTQKTRPSGVPTLTSSTAGPSLAWGQSATFDIPASWAQAMVDGSAGGLGLYESDGSPYVILDGRGAYSASFALTIYWKRTS